MRPLIIAVLMIMANPVLTAAQTMPTMAPSTYPEPGTFCGLLTLCPKVAPPTDDA
jgi:hypothetical protein